MIFINCCFIGVILTFYEMCLIFDFKVQKHDFDDFNIYFSFIGEILTFCYILMFSEIFEILLKSNSMKRF